MTKHLAITIALLESESGDVDPRDVEPLLYMVGERLAVRGDCIATLRSIAPRLLSYVLVPR